MLFFDKDEKNRDLQSFVAGDVKTFKDKYPGFTCDQIRVGTTGGIIDAVMYSFGDLSGRHKEEVIYMETAESILVFAFAATTSSDHERFQPVFEKFVASFNYRGNNPKPYLDWLKSKN